MLSSSTLLRLINVSEQIIFYGSFLTLIAGLLGNTINTVVFSTKLNNSPCSLYLLVLEICNSFKLIISLVPIIVFKLHGSNGTEKSIVWCRVQSYLGYTFTFISVVLLCLAAVDRYCSTCRSANRRKWSSMRVAKIAIPISLIFVLLLNVPDLLFSDCPVKTVDKPFFSDAYEVYVAYFLIPILRTTVPAVFLSIFAYFTHRNLKTVATTQVRRRETQLIILWLLQVLYFQLVSIPLLLYLIYNLITKTHTKNITRQVIELLLAVIAFVINSTCHSNNFYVYYLCSRNYRIIVNKLLFGCYYRRSSTRS
jgi:hypothetical protein